MNNINTEMVKKLLAGHNRINEMDNKLRQEINVFVNMILGLLTKVEISSFKFGKRVCSFESAGLHWEATKWKGGYIGVCVGTTNTPLSSSVYRSDVVADCNVNINNTPAQYLLPIHQGLPDFLANMIKVFPDLENRFTPFLNAASWE